MKRDYDWIIYAEDGSAARAAYDAFVKKWSTLCSAVAKALPEAGLELLTFYELPKETWKSIRTTTRSRISIANSSPNEVASLVQYRGLP